MIDVNRVIESTKYRFLINYLKEKIESDIYIDRDELKKILKSLDVKFKEENNE